uniref:Uncharacterized protein n=1 Tax=Cucumis melo TaxID=3656 RepID=A0A9I9E6M8_CUCME
MAKPTSFLLQFTLLVCFTAIHGRTEITSFSCDSYVSYFAKSSQFLYFQLEPSTSSLPLQF